MKVKFAQILVKEKLVKSVRKETDVPIKFKLNGKRLYPTDSMTYLDMKIYQNLNWLRLAM